MLGLWFLVLYMQYQIFRREKDKTIRNKSMTLTALNMEKKSIIPMQLVDFNRKLSLLYLIRKESGFHKPVI